MFKHPKLGAAIAWQFPNLNLSKDIVIQDDGSGGYIKEWNLAQARPTDEQQNTLVQNYIASKAEETNIVIHNRRNQYPQIRDQIEVIMKYLAKTASTDADLKPILDQIQQVKDNNPLP